MDCRATEAARHLMAACVILPGPWRVISVSRPYRPALSQREQATARTAVWVAT
jgi:hypothetical protein